MYQEQRQVKGGKPCTFCGSEPVLIQELRYPELTWETEVMKRMVTYRAVCSNMQCPAHFMERPYFRTRDEATENWNRRI